MDSVLFKEKDKSPQSPTTSVQTSDLGAKRSCLLCHQRKIRCDRGLPCGNCERADLLCCYPAPQRKGRTPHKLTITDVAARLARLERTVNAISNNTESSSETSEKKPRRIGDNVERSNASTPQNEEFLVRDGYSSRYVNEDLYSRILDEAS
jgi:hypothetical protein